MFKEFDVIKSLKTLSPNIDIGTLGTILIIHNEEEVEVEFVDTQGKTLDLLTVSKNDIELLK
ncbi:DUF4926 domain-containing protein [Litchfieldia salsa]|uniref:DUF4926 domain-containing protein n=1 Tax=Litchfieldia salsa TaxID=930152 RepID=A0A1H0X1B5_9BACI|nr:DUF4926 domain-containing protein [Litchfieldia salsa]SDP96256.1 protein of unknown function [Litchfieldia salsa]